MICLECRQSDLTFNIFKALVLPFLGRAEAKAAVISA